MRIWVALLVAVLSSLPFIYLQTPERPATLAARFTVDTDAPLIGQPFVLELTVQASAEMVVIMPQFSSDWPPFTIINAGAVTSTTAGDTTTYHQQLTVVLWRPGDYRTPETMATYQLPGASEQNQVSIEAVSIHVPSVLNPDDLNLRAFKPPILLPYIPWWTFVIGGAGLVGIAAGGGWLFWKWRLAFKQRALIEASGGLSPSAQNALRELKRLAGQGDSAVVYPAVADCLRLYIQERFGIRAQDMTTEEIMQWQSHLPGRLMREFEHILERADVVKFAALEPKATAAQRLIGLAQQWVTAVEADMVGKP